MCLFPIYCPPENAFYYFISFKSTIGVTPTKAKPLLSPLNTQIQQVITVVSARQRREKIKTQSGGVKMGEEWRGGSVLCKMLRWIHHHTPTHTDKHTHTGACEVEGIIRKSSLLLELHKGYVCVYEHYINCRLLICCSLSTVRSII